MTLKSKVDFIDDVREEYRGEYKERDGKFFLQVEPVDGYALENVDGIKKVLEEVKGERSELRDKVKKLESSVSEKDSSISELKATQNEKAKEQIEEVREALLSDFQEKLSEKDSTIDDLSAKYKQTKIHDAIVRNMGGRFTANGMSVLPDILAKQVKLDDDGEPVVKNDKGHIRTGEGGKDMTISELVAETEQKFPEFVRAEGSKGTGSNGSEKPNSSTAKVKKSEWRGMSTKEKKQLMFDENGNPREGFEIVNT